MPATTWATRTRATRADARAATAAAAMVIVGAAVPARPAVNVRVDAEGVYAVPAATLEGAGLALPGAAGASVLRLSCRGKAVAFRPVAEGGRIRAVEFLASDPALRLGIPVVYRLEQAPGGRLVRTIEPSGPPDRSVVHTERLERAEIYLPRLILNATRGESSDPWVMRVISSPRGDAVDIEISAPDAGQARVRARLYGHTHLPVSPDHHLVVRLNDEVIGEARWDGQTEHVFDSGPVDAALLRPGRNVLRLDLPGDVTQGQNVPAIDQVHLDWVEVSHPRRLVEGNGPVSLSPSRRPGSVAVDARDPVELELWTDAGTVGPGRPARGGGVACALPSHGGARAVLVSGGGKLAPRDVAAARPSPDPEGPVDYLAIGPASMLGSLEPLLDRRRAEGLRVATASCEGVHDRFGHGNPGDGAIKEMVRHLHGRSRGRLRYLLLVGDASLGAAHDPEARRADLLPSHEVFDRSTDRAASDTWFGDLSGDAAPEVAVGRIPARTPEQVVAAARKTLAFEDQASGAWRRQAILVAGVARGAEADFFAKASDAIAEASLPPSMRLTRVYLEPSGVTSDHPVDRVPDPAATKRVLGALEDGALLAHYVGHGGLNVWEDRQLLTLDDARRLTNGARLPVVLSMSCFTAFFDDYRSSCIGEELLLAPGGGAAAFWGSTGRSIQNGNTHLSRLLLAELFSKGSSRLGDAIGAAFRRFLAEKGPASSVRSYALLGDPALRVEVPADAPGTR